MAASRKRARRAPDPAPPLTPSVAFLALLGLKRYTALEVIGHISKGLSFSAFEHLRAAMDLPSAELAELAGIPARTLQRRKEEGRLQPDESDRLVRLSRVYGLSLELFEGDQAQARHWLASPQLAFGQRSPLSLTSTEVGAREVEALIGRLEHGVFS